MKFELNDRVFCRDQGKKDWLRGVVVDVEPLKILVDGWPVPMEFDEVKEEVPEKDSKACEPVVLTLKQWQHRFLVGKGGSVIANLRNITGAKIELDFTENKQYDASRRGGRGRGRGRGGYLFLRPSFRHEEGEYKVRISGGEKNVQSAVKEIEQHLENICQIDVEENRAVGWIVGKNGETIKFLQKEYGVELSFVGTILYIVGSKDRAELVNRRISEIKKDGNFGRSFGGWYRGKQLVWKRKKAELNWFGVAKFNKSRHARKKKSKTLGHRARQNAAHKAMRRANKDWVKEPNFSVMWK